jgi:hypothetical protein
MSAYLAFSADERRNSNAVQLEDGMRNNQGGDRGKSPNKTGTLPKPKREAVGSKPGRKSVKGGPKRGARGKHAAARARGARTSETRKAGPKKTPAGTTTRSGDK